MMIARIASRGVKPPFPAANRTFVVITHLRCGCAHARVLAGRGATRFVGVTVVISLSEIQRIALPDAGEVS
jgi:hypothetical protein